MSRTPFNRCHLLAGLGLLLLAARRYRAWRRELDAQGSLPPADALRRTRSLVMWSAHLMVVVVLLAVLLARGVGTR